MKCLRLLLCLALVGATLARAQDATSELRTLVQQIQAKLQAGKGSAEALAPELAAFDELVAKYKGTKSEEAAQIAFVRATLYLQVMREPAKARAMLAQIETDYPGTPTAAKMGAILAGVERQEKAQAAKAALVGKPAPELHFTWSSQDGLTTLSALKGKVVVLDFWATWCGPCISSFPQVRDLAEHYGTADVIVLGVTSLQGKVVNLEPRPISTQGNPQREMALMKDFMKAKEMTWPVVFSQEEVFNPDYGVTGIPHMAIIAPDGTVRYNGLHPGSPLEEKIEKIDPLLKEFGLAVPAAK